MPDTENSSNSIYPTEWHGFDQHLECRQTSVDTYQLRDSSKVITLDTQGFKLFRETHTLEGALAFVEWCKANGNPTAVPRDDV